MQADIDHLRSLRANGFSVAPEHGEAPQTNFTRYTYSGRGLALGIIITFLAFFILWAIFSFVYEDHKVLAAAQALNYGLSLGIWVALLYYIYPVFAVLFKTIRHGQWPNRVMLRQYSTAQIYVSSILFSLILCFLLNSATGIVMSWLHGHFAWESRYIPPEKMAIDKSGLNKAALDSLNLQLALLFLMTGILMPILVRQIKYLNNLIEQDHRAIKKIINPMKGFKSFAAAEATLAGIELHHMLRKGQYADAANMAVYQQFYALGA